MRVQACWGDFFAILFQGAGKVQIPLAFLKPKAASSERSEQHGPEAAKRIRLGVITCRRRLRVFARSVHILACIHFQVIISSRDNRPYQYIFRVFFRVFRVLFRVFFRENAILRVFMVFQTPLTFMHLKCGPKAGRDNRPYQYIFRVFFRVFFREKAIFRVFRVSWFFQIPLAKEGHCKETSVTSIKRVTYVRYMRTKIRFEDFAKLNEIRRSVKLLWLNI